MKTRDVHGASRMIILLLAVLLMLAASPVMAWATHTDDVPTKSPEYGATFDDPRQPQSSCCRGGASPWASESPDTFKSNPRAGYQGSELPTSTGYNPDRLDSYGNPLNNRYEDRGDRRTR